MESEVEIRKDIKRHLRECITENEKLALKINHLKYSNMMLRKERDLLLERLAKTNTDVISSDSEAETEMKSKVFGKSNGFSGLSIKSTPKSKQSGSAQHTPTDFREPKKKLRRAHYVFYQSTLECLSYCHWELFVPNWAITLKNTFIL
jgi:hypothetical protein